MVNFLHTGVGLEVSFRNITKVPADQTPVWDFGDSTEEVKGLNPKHTYAESGFYQPTLKLCTDEPYYIVVDMALVNYSGSVMSHPTNVIPGVLSSEDDYSKYTQWSGPFLILSLDKQETLDIDNSYGMFGLAKLLYSGPVYHVTIGDAISGSKALLLKGKGSSYVAPFFVCSEVNIGDKLTLGITIGYAEEFNKYLSLGVYVEDMDGNHVYDEDIVLSEVEGNTIEIERSFILEKVSKEEPTQFIVNISNRGGGIFLYNTTLKREAFIQYNTVVHDEVTKTVVVSDTAKTHLTDSIYNLIDRYIPSNLALSMTMEDKQVYLTKWQLYLQPLVNHDIPLEEYANELYYEGLENQLIMELAAYDYLYTKLEQMLAQTAHQLEGQAEESSGDSDKDGGRDRIKQITTGPTEVQYYDTVTDSISTLFKAYTEATKPGGILDDLRKNLCMLAQRLEIYLPFCDQVISTVTPRVVNHRKPGPIDGPNPGSLVFNPHNNLL